jgi:thiamine biosynthesis lipoprotein
VKRGVLARTTVAMGTLVSIQIVGDDRPLDQRHAAVERAFDWFSSVEACCSRFDPSSELHALIDRPGEAVPVSTTLFEAVRFAAAMAEESHGAFDPVVGAAMESRGFNQHYASAETAASGVADDPAATYRDIVLDPTRSTITLTRPMLLDLGAVAKGLAVDMAARELAGFRDFAIDAGGDLFFSGRNADGDMWSVGIRHPRDANAIVHAARVSGCAVCTSGDYEKRAADGSAHILDPRTRMPATAASSATAVAGTAMLADAAATAGFVLGPVEGIRFFERLGIEGLVISSTLERFATRGMPSEGGPAVFSNS